MSKLLVSIASVLLLSAAPVFCFADDTGTLPRAPAAGAGDEASSKSFALKPAERILLVVGPNCERCQEALIHLRTTGGPFDALRQSGWRIGGTADSDIQIVDLSLPVDGSISGVVGELEKKGLPAVALISGTEIVRSFQRGCTTPLDQWTFGWLKTGNDERPVAFEPEAIEVETSGHYPLRGNHWSVEGNWFPTHAELVHHLRLVHVAELKPDWKIETWAVEELRSLHDDVHEREEGFRGRYQSAAASRPSKSSNGVFRKPGNAAR